MQKIMKVLSLGMCAFSEAYYSDGGFLQRTKQSVFTGNIWWYIVFSLMLFWFIFKDQNMQLTQMNVQDVL